jgi:hypothetical protein
MGRGFLCFQICLLEAFDLKENHKEYHKISSVSVFFTFLYNPKIYSGK